MAAFRCPDGSLENDGLVITLVLETAQVDPLAPALVPLEITRESTRCLLYQQGPEYTLATLHLEYPAPLDYFSDFSTPPGPEWSSSKRSTSPAGETFLGTFRNQDVDLTFESLGPHQEVTLELDLYVIGSWNGWDPGQSNAHDQVVVAVEGGEELLRSTFSNKAGDEQNYPDPTGGGLHAAGTGASAVESLGYSRDDGAWGDSTYSLSYTFPHTSDVLRIRFRANTTAGGEVIGLDNVRVRSR